MKKINYLLMSLFIATMSIAFTSCSSDDDEDENALVGAWESINVEEDGTKKINELLFNNDGTGDWTITTHYKNRKEPEQPLYYPFKYSYAAELKELAITFDDKEMGAALFTATITGNTLSLIDKESKTILTYTRK